jgi:hypothetical protein
MAAKTYNLKRCIVTVNTIEVEGFGENDAISFEPNEDMWNYTVGGDGEGTRSRMNNDSYTITLTLMQNSESLMVLQQAYLADLLSGNSKFVLTVDDLETDEHIVAEDCWVQRPPTKAFARQVGEREWRITASAVRWAPLTTLDFDFPGGLF